MTTEAQQIAIAEACGYERRLDGYWREKGMVGSCGIPDYLNDLNAMHEAEKFLDEMPNIHGPGVGICSAIEVYEDMLLGMCDHPIRATAAQRCEAFLKTLNKWIDDN